MVGGASPSTWNFGSTCSHWTEIADFEPIVARSASAIIPSEKVQLTLIGSLHAHSNEPKMIIVRCPWAPKGGSKTQNGRFRCKIALRLMEVCYEVSLCENCQRQSCKAFIGLTIRAKVIGGGDHFYLKFWVKVTALERNRLAKKVQLKRLLHVK